jgi:hypothetical protein
MGLLDNVLGLQDVVLMALVIVRFRGGVIGFPLVVDDEL